MSDGLKPDPLDLPKDESKDDPLAAMRYSGRYVVCPRCRGTMVDCDFLLPSDPQRSVNQITIARAVQARNWRYEKVSNVKAMACRNCGYMEMYTTQPENL